MVVRKVTTNHPAGDFAAWMGALQARVEAALARLLPGPDIVPQRLHQAMRYAVLGGGKRVRPLLAFAAGDLAGADSSRTEIVACALECIHTYSLVHDDLPCMDDDILRRGRSSCHVEYDEATALLVGDSLQSFAFQLLGENRLTDGAVAQLEMIRILAAACGSRGMAGGQAFDLASVGKALTVPELEHMHIRKTGALIRASVALGAYCGTALSKEERDHLDRYARAIGLAFQVVDDLLDCEASTATLGKTAGKDAAAKKPTYVSVLGVARARDLAEDLRADAHKALSGFGEKSYRLAALADFIVLRKF
ncbi:MAG: geranyl transferase [Betaproteobacteria bacterium RIFCSPLOWO2_12_FULL_63_13]|nr:MAG: geranyl transferase [Betaproteobacteria bacterium RIFCSPLOWO2_02_FULL_63_19]OGA42634.1 MAG: geranyl transferase [Betaproteobacteria bacterium RIFCSPLOWO2_12_FULL_63_13]